MARSSLAFKCSRHRRDIGRFSVWLQMSSHDDLKRKRRKGWLMIDRLSPRSKVLSVLRCLISVDCVQRT